MPRIQTIAVLLLGTACATTSSRSDSSGGAQLEPQVTRFQTFDNTSPISDFDAASYYGVVVAGQRLGEVAVWSNGAFAVDAHGEQVPVLELTLLARNESQQPFELDLAGTGVSLAEPAMAAITDELEVAGTRVVQPGETRRLSLRYRLPNAGLVKTLVDWSLAWTMRTPAGAFVQVTPFRLLPPGQFELGAEWPQTKRISYTQDNRRPWSIRWSAVTPEPGDRQVDSGEELPAPKWQAPPATTEAAPRG